MTVVLYKSSSNKNRLQVSQQNIFESDYKYINTFHLHDFVKFCLCISLHVCVLVWLYHVGSPKRVVCVCVYVWMCVCLCEESKQGFSALFLASGKKKKKTWNRSYLPQNRSTELRLEKKLPKNPTPAAFPCIPASFRRFSSLHFVPRPPSSHSSSSLFIEPAFFVYHLFFF